MTVVAGSYERFLFGYSHPTNASENEPKLSRTFTYAAHKGIVKSLAAAGPFIASGGADDLIHLYNNNTSKDLGFLMNPAEGSVTSLQFFVPVGGFTPTHLLSGCSDGTLSIWKAGGGWECMKTLRGHRREITGIAIHPSGRLALTTSLDGTMRLWDLVKGRTTFTTKVEGGAEGILFSPSGTKYALLTRDAVAVRAVGEASESSVLMQHSGRVLCMTFGGGDEILITGSEDGSLRVWRVDDGGHELLYIPRAHSTRIKAMVPLKSSLNGGKGAENTNNCDGDGDLQRSSGPGSLVASVPELLATASSDGVVKVWALRPAIADALERGTPEAEDGGGASCLCYAETRARVTTLCCLHSAADMAKQAAQHAKQQQGSKRTKANDSGGGKKANTKHREGKNTRRGPHIPPKSNGGETPKNVTVKRKAEVDGKSSGGVVSFMDEGDTEKQRKKQRQVHLNAQRAAGHRSGRKQQRLRPPGNEDFPKK